MRKLKKFNEKWDYTPGKVADHELAEEIANDLLPRLQKMREEGKQVTVADFDKYMEERGATFELSDSVMNMLVEGGFDFDVENEEEDNLPEPYLKENAEGNKVSNFLKNQIEVAFENTVMCARTNPPNESYEYAKRMANMVIRMIEEGK